MKLHCEAGTKVFDVEKWRDAATARYTYVPHTGVPTATTFHTVARIYRAAIVFAPVTARPLRNITAHIINPKFIRFLCLNIMSLFTASKKTYNYHCV